MSRSIHTTYSKFIKLKRKYDENKKPEDVKPRDFVELDYKRNLEYHSQIFFKDYIE